MNAKEQAIKDIKSELKKQNKAFIAFRQELNPVMRKLVSQQLRSQERMSSLFPINKASSQLIARCFFSKATGNVSFDNYSEYYEK